MSSKASIAVIGGGWAGCAAAVNLAAAGHAVTLFEASRTLGGRARVVAIGDRQLDNGQHILLGAYTETLGHLKQVGVDTNQALLRLPLQMRYPSACDGMVFVAPKLPAPLHLLLALLRASGLTRDDKMALARFSSSARWMEWRLNEDCSVLTLLERFDQTDRLIRLMWRPLCIAALNTPLEHASAQVFLNVLHDSLGASRAASDMLIPRVDLSALFPAQAARYLAAHGGKVLTGAGVRSIAQNGERWMIDTNVGTNDAQELSFDGVVLATSSSAATGLLESILPGALPALLHEPITTCYLQYPADTRLEQAMYALLDDAAQAHWGQFVFDRGYLQEDQKGLLAVVISTSSDASALPQNDLIDAVARQLAAAFSRPALAAPLWTQVITEKRATFSCTPALQRAEERTGIASLVLAGDYLAGPYPATIEAAVRSGKKAAGLLVDHFSKADQAH